MVDDRPAKGRRAASPSLRRLVAGAVAALLCALVLFPVTRLRSEAGELASRQQAALEQLHVLTGYGGMIHNFKNLVLRPAEPEYGEVAAIQAEVALDVLDELEADSTSFGAEIADARSTISAYRNAIDVVLTLQADGWPIGDVDRAVRIDDSEALGSLEALELAIAESVTAARDDQRRLSELLIVLASVGVGVIAMFGIAFGTVRDEQRVERLHTEDLQHFTRIAAHDLKAPLHQISSLVGFLRDDLSSGESQASLEYNLGRIDERIHHLDRRLGAVFDYLRPDCGAAEADVIELEEMVRELASAVLPSGATLDVGSLGTTTAQRAKLETVVANLISNAVKHHPTQTPHIVIRRIERRGRSALSVGDDGPGIPADRLDEAFELHSSLDELADPNSGVGLAMIRRIVTGWGGRIEVELASPHGAVFVFDLPEVAGRGRSTPSVPTGNSVARPHGRFYNLSS